MIRRSCVVQACLFSFVVFAIASRTPTAEGGCADYDGDDRVTLADFSAFFGVFTAP
jgi:hypothetical protein